MKKHTLSIVLAALCMAASPASSQVNVTPTPGFQHFNPAVIGSAADDPVTPLRRLRPTDVAPTSVTLHVSSNRCDGAPLRFPKRFTMAEAIRSIETAFPKCKPSMTLYERRMVWEDSETGFAVSLRQLAAEYELVYSGQVPPRKPTLKDLPETETKINLKTL